MAGLGQGSTDTGWMNPGWYHQWVMERAWHQGLECDSVRIGTALDDDGRYESSSENHQLLISWGPLHQIHTDVTNHLHLQKKSPHTALTHSAPFLEVGQGSWTPVSSAPQVPFSTEHVGNCLRAGSSDEGGGATRSCARLWGLGVQSHGREVSSVTANTHTL